MTDPHPDPLLFALAALFADAIRRIHGGGSLVDLLDPAAPSDTLFAAGHHACT